MSIVDDPYVEFRSDGWPLCPCCGEDELYSLAIPATGDTIVGCYRCGPRQDAARGVAAALSRVESPPQAE